MALYDIDAGAAPLALTLVLLGIWFIAGCERLYASAVAGFGWHFGNFAQPLYDLSRLLAAEFRPGARPDGLLWLGGPLILLGTAASALVVLPPPEAAGNGLGIGVVFFTGLFALVVLAAYLSERAGDARLPPAAALRYAGLILAYEAPLALAVAAASLPSGSLSLDSIVVAQQSGIWNCLLMPLGLLIYLVSGVALAFWGPFHLLEADDATPSPQLARTPLLLWRLGHYAMLLVLAAFAAPLFLGGGAGPWLPPPLWVLLKTLLAAAVLTALPHALPRRRLHGFMQRAWVWLVPLALLNLMLVVLRLRPDLTGGA